MPEIMSANLGRLGLPDDIESIKVERAYFAPSSAFGMDIVLGVATAGNQLSITLNYFRGYTDSKKMKVIRDRGFEIMKEIITE